MNGVTMTLTVLPVSALLAFALTAAAAYFLGRRLKRRVPAILVAGLALPLTIIFAALYAVSTDEPDGPPPGMVLLGALSVAALTTPVTLILSGIAVRFARR